jgi:hypothetical protein
LDKERSIASNDLDFHEQLYHQVGGGSDIYNVTINGNVSVKQVV